MKLLRFKNNNKGMTLVELLVAIAIFAAAIIPMLYAFVYSTAFNFKSQQTMQSTGIAQAIIEKCKGANVGQDQIVAMLTDGSIFDGTQFINGTANGLDGSNYYCIDGIQPVASTDGGTSRRAYDVKVKFTEIGKDAKTDFSSIQSMTNDTTYNFTDFLTEALAHEDALAEDKILNMIKDKWFVDSNCTYTDGTACETGVSSYLTIGDIDMSKIKLDRVIKIDISDSEVKVTVTYYFAGYDTAGAYDNISFTKSGVHGKTLKCTSHFSSSVTGEDIALGGSSNVYQVDFDSYMACSHAVTSVFFYYYPGYMSESNIQDHFEINSSMSSPVTYHPDPSDLSVTAQAPQRLDVYLYKQFKPFAGSWTETSYNTKDAAYDPQIVLNNSGTTESYFYHNLWWHVTNTSVNPGEHDYKLVLNSGYTPDITATDFENCTAPDTVVSSNPYSTYYRDVTNDASGKPKMNSHLLRDYESLPGHFEDTRGGAETTRDSFYSRYRIEVIVYSASNGNEVERMYAEVMNW